MKEPPNRFVVPLVRACRLIRLLGPTRTASVGDVATRVVVGVGIALDTVSDRLTASTIHAPVFFPPRQRCFPPGTKLFST